MTHKYFSLLLLSTLLALSSFILTSKAERVLKSLKKPIPISLATALDGKTLKVGDPFEGVLNETQSYQKLSIPEGTLFRGHVIEIDPSKRFARAGHFQLQVDEAVLPSGEVYAFDIEKFERRTKHYHHKKGVTVKRLLTNSLPMVAVTMGTGIPLHFATTLSSFVILPISLAARTTAAFVMEVPNRAAHQDMAHVVGYSFARGSGALATYNFFRVSQSPSFAQGQTLVLYLDPAWTKGLMQANEDVQLLNSTSAEF